jgi:uncharacterized protein (TIGR03067 family)
MVVVLVATEAIMYRVILVALVTGTIFAADQPSDEAVTKELKHFQGKWEAIFAQNIDGKLQTDVELQLTNLEVDGDKFTMKTGSLTVSGTFTVDPSKKVKTIDIFLGDSKDNVMRGIYEIKGNTRKSCFAEPSKDRPDRFRNKEKGYLILEWRQVK